MADISIAILALTLCLLLIIVAMLLIIAAGIGEAPPYHDPELGSRLIRRRERKST